MPRAAVLGSPIAHSLSPTLHLAAYRLLGLDWQYSAIECTEAEFPAFFAGLDDEWRGLSLTMPLKEVVLQVVEHASDVAKTVRSANTVYRSSPDTDWTVTNTDIQGIENALRDVGVVALESATVLGAGATARSAVAAIAGLGGKNVDIHARRAEAAEDVATVARTFGLEATIGDLTPEPIECDLLVSTLPADVAAPWTSVTGSTRGTALLDASYHPWPTPLADAWQRGGVGPLASGRDMLVWQAVAQVRVMTGMDFDEARIVEAMRRALEGLSTAPT